MSKEEEKSEKSKSKNELKSHIPVSCFISWYVVFSWTIS